jgi:16S rRNA (guanine(966)-N(2))-methyltransferase RsmD
MRIIGGALKGRTFGMTVRSGTRPTQDAIREAIFNHLSHELDWKGLRVADLCCGTGALGFEALSRGATRCLMVDSSRQVMRDVLSDARDLQFGDHCAGIVAPVFTVLEQPAQEQFDVVFADPPYDARLCNGIVHRLLVQGWCAPNALIVLEHDDREAVLTDDRLSLTHSLHRSGVVVDFLRVLP